jgi:N-acetylneuraminic acid mutarotase
MRKFLAFLLPFGFAILLFAASNPKFPPLPVAVSGNAVASLRGGLELYSLMGIGNKKTWDDVKADVYVLRLASAKWREERPVPGVGGRLGAAAIGVKNRIYVFGGYLVDNQGSEITVSDVNAYLPDEHRWYRGEDVPVGVDRTVIGLTHDRYVYLIGGRSTRGPVNNVQVYDTLKNTWSEATPFPGTPVFGHAGGVVDDTIIIVDGAMKNPAVGASYVASDQCWMGRIDKKDPSKIAWNKLPPHPGPGRFGIAAGVYEHKIVFSGGSTKPHNFKGLDFDGKPAELSNVSFTFDVHGNHWDTIADDNLPARSDAGGILSTPVGPVMIGGVLQNLAPTGRVDLVLRK